MSDLSKEEAARDALGNKAEGGLCRAYILQGWDAAMAYAAQEIAEKDFELKNSMHKQMVLIQMKNEVQAKLATTQSALDKAMKALELFFHGYLRNQSWKTISIDELEKTFTELRALPQAPIQQEGITRYNDALAGGRLTSDNLLKKSGAKDE